METRSSNRLRPAQPTVTAQQNGRAVPHKLTPRRRCRSETLPINDGIQLHGTAVEAKLFDDLPDSQRKQQQQQQQQHQNQHRFRNLMMLQHQQQQHNKYANDAVLRNQDSAKNIFSCQTTSPYQHQQQQQQQQPQSNGNGRTPRSSRLATAASAPPLFSSRQQQHPRKENLVGEAAARSARVQEFERDQQKQQHQQPMRGGSLYVTQFDREELLTTTTTTTQQAGYEIVTRSSARKPASPAAVAAAAESAKRRIRSRSESEPHDHRRPTTNRRSPVKSAGTKRVIDPTATFKRARDDRLPSSGLTAVNGRHAHPHNVISLAGLSGTAASATVLAIDRSDVPPTGDQRIHHIPISVSAASATTAPPIAVNPKYTKIVTHHLLRGSTPRFTVKPLNNLRRLRSRQALAKAKATVNGAAVGTRTMVVTVTNRVSTPLAIAGSAGATTTPVRTLETKVTRSSGGDGTRGDDSDTNCSSLEDDDDFDDMGGEGDFNDSLSDMEDGGSQLSSLSTSLDGKLSDASITTTECVAGRYAASAPLSASLFAHCSPYIAFASHSEKGPPMPAAVQKVLKWKLTTITPIVIRKVLLNTGFRLLRNVPTPEPTPDPEHYTDDDEIIEEVDETNDWMGVWGKHMKSPCFKTLRSYQKINHIPGTFQIGRKDRVWRNLQTQMVRHGKKEFGFMPRTYVIPNDLKQLRKVWPRYAQHNVKWIIKPPASARGTGIKVVNRWSQIPKRKPLIVQRYIERPLLINGSKFDLRLYVLVTSINPLRVYMHTDGLARFASVKYSEKTDTLHDRYMHLTNYSINKLSANYAKNEDANACKGHKWTVKSLWTHLEAQGINTAGLWGAMRNLVLRTILAGENSINAMTKGNMCSRYNCFELFGIDVLLDSELKPWLLEVNISPSLHSASPLDLHVKGPLCTALLNTALFQVPPRLPVAQQHEILAEQGLAEGNLCYDKRLFVTNTTKAERTKHAEFTNASVRLREHYQNAILKHLTPDDVRTLMIAEDELARSAPLERIFPSPTSYKYLKFLEQPRYHNRLLDAWEHRYGGSQKQRDEGIALLRRFADDRVHLIVPPQPVKKDSESNVPGDDAAAPAQQQQHAGDDDDDAITTGATSRSKVDFDTERNIVHAATTDDVAVVADDDDTAAVTKTMEATRLGNGNAQPKNMTNGGGSGGGGFGDSIDDDVDADAAALPPPHPPAQRLLQVTKTSISATELAAASSKVTGLSN